MLPSLTRTIQEKEYSHMRTLTLILKVPPTLYLVLCWRMGAQERGILSPAPPYPQGISASVPPSTPGKNILRADGWEAHSSYVKAISSCSISDPQRGRDLLPVPLGESAEIPLWAASRCLLD